MLWMLRVNCRTGGCDGVRRPALIGRVGARTKKPASTATWRRMACIACMAAAGARTTAGERRLGASKDWRRAAASVSGEQRAHRPMLRCRGRGAPVLLQGRPRSLAPRVPARCRATHKDLPDPPKKGKDEKVEQDLKQGKVDPETLRRLAKSLTPEEVRPTDLSSAVPCSLPTAATTTTSRANCYIVVLQ